MEQSAEFDRQAARLVVLGYPQLAGVSEAEFLEDIEPLRRLVEGSGEEAASNSSVPWVLVTTRIDPESLVPLLHLHGGTNPGVIDRNHGEEGLASYVPLPVLDIPEGPAYIAFGVERGEEFCDVRPQDALPVILDRGRTPLTIAEGIALVTQFPGVLEKNRCFMLAGSRRGDKRVPALWISGKAPKLGWCWDGNPHTWLGTASLQRRAGLA